LVLLNKELNDVGEIILLFIGLFICMLREL